jgi:phosphoglycerate dehydrogenase-like enzyme
LTLASRASVTGPILDLLPEDGVFINIGRGAVVDEQALLHRAASGRLRVALDVFSQEPPRPNSDFLLTRNVLLSPHIAGPTSNTFSQCGEFAMNNLRLYLQGQQVLGAVSLETYDRLM